MTTEFRSILFVLTTSAHEQTVDNGREFPVYDMQILGPIANAFQFSDPVGYPAAP